MKRSEIIAKLSNTSRKWDMIVIGGGAVGLGIALDATSRGLEVLLLEKGDFGQETSSRSTKLIHGGLRYLQQWQIPLVHTALSERAILTKNAPHLINPITFIVPAETASSFLYYVVGLKAYDLLAGSRSWRTSKGLSIETMKEKYRSIPYLQRQRGISYMDAQFDDARLAINLAQTIVEGGSSVINYMPVVDFLKASNKICGVIAKDLETEDCYEIHSHIVINATGAFVDQLRNLDDPDFRSSLVASQGAHIVLPKEFFPDSDALIIPKTTDNRLLFIIPWYNHILIGTTETALKEVVSDPKPQDEEINFLLEHASKYLAKPATANDITSSFAGIRALSCPSHRYQSSASLSREHEVIIDQSRLISVIGGKWTTYRHVAEDVVKTIARQFHLDLRPSQTKTLHIHGWQDLSNFNIDSLQSPWSYYGSDLSHVEALRKAENLSSETLSQKLSCREVDVRWAVRHEMARQLSDVLARRTRSLFLDSSESLKIAPQVASIMAEELGCDAIWQKKQLEKVQG